MPGTIELESTTNFFVVAAWVAGAVTIAYALGLVLSWTAAAHRQAQRHPPRRRAADAAAGASHFMVIAASAALRRVSDATASWRGWLDHALVIALIGALTWMVASLVVVAERQVIARIRRRRRRSDRRRPAPPQDPHPGDRAAPARHRRRRRVGRRGGIDDVPVVQPTSARPCSHRLACCRSSPDLAAQTSLGAVFAGIQIAFSDAIRVGDVVVLEDEWGRIEEITLTYVVVHVWDERRLVLPCTYFTTTPFQNWTRNATELLGYRRTRRGLHRAVRRDARRAGSAAARQPALG